MNVSIPPELGSLLAISPSSQAVLKQPMKMKMTTSGSEPPAKTTTNGSTRASEVPGLMKVRDWNSTSVRPTLSDSSVLTLPEPAVTSCGSALIDVLPRELRMGCGLDGAEVDRQADAGDVPRRVRGEEEDR